MEIKIEPYLKIDVYSHFFKVTRFTPRILGLLLKFAHKYTHISFVQRQQGPSTPEPKTYAIKTKDDKEFRFHVGQLQHFIEFLGFEHIQPEFYEINRHELYTPKQYPLQLKPKWNLREEQIEAENFILTDTSDDFHSRLVTMPTGSGKFQPLDALVKVPGGWTKMGDIELGTTVTAWDGTPSKVIGIYPQGSQPIVKITFQDDRSTECGLDHLWRVYNDKWNSVKRGKWRVINTAELLKLRHVKGNRYYIQLIKPENVADIDLPVDPYTLGALIGEAAVKALTVKDKEAENDYQKFIPEAYLHASKIQRSKLLQGLLQDSNTSFSTDSESLAKSVQYLVRSLGGIATINLGLEHRPYRGEKRPNGQTYIVNIGYLKPFELDSETSSNNDVAKLGIVSITLAPRHKECQCIQIDHPDHLYVTDDFIVTHNTVTAMSVTVKRKNRTLILVPAKYMEKWQSDVDNIADIKAKRDIMGISGSTQLKGLISLAKDKQYVPLFIVLSLTTIQNYFKAYEEDRFSDEFKEYLINPEDFCKTLDIGTIIVDEAHEQLYSTFKFMCYTNAPKLIALSGTYISSDPFIERIQKVLFPKEIRFDKIKMKKYIKVYPISYVFRDFTSSKIRTTEFGSRNYSQTAFEKSLMKNLPIFKNYLTLICQLIDLGYLSEYKTGDKLAIYAGSIAMCTAITEHIKQKYAHLDVRRYVESDPYENVIEADIRVTTITSAGTAIDIPQLTTVIMTNSVNSPVANLQTLGRLRELPGRDPKFFYLFSTEIQKQLDYHRKRMELFQDRVAVIKEFKSPIAL